jgi:hypothetical protein
MQKVANRDVGGFREGARSRGPFRDARRFPSTRWYPAPEATRTPRTFRSCPSFEDPFLSRRALVSRFANFFIAVCVCAPRPRSSRGEEARVESGAVGSVVVHRVCTALAEPVSTIWASQVPRQREPRGSSWRLLGSGTGLGGVRYLTKAAQQLCFLDALRSLSRSV